MLGYISPVITYIGDFLDQTIFINQHTKLVFCSNNPFFIVKDISDKFTLLESFEGFYNQVWPLWLFKRNYVFLMSTKKECISSL